MKELALWARGGCSQLQLHWTRVYQVWVLHEAGVEA